MTLDFTLVEVMRLSSIQRWGIIEMSRSQSVAEHSYNVAMISMAIIERFEDEGQLSFNTCAQAMSWALVHDLPELLTGDVPTTAKDYIDLELLERELCPLYDDLRQKIDGSLVKVIVKAADFIDAIQFAEKFCVDTRKNEILHDIRENLSEYLSKDSNVLVAGAVEKLGF